jgi:hypothetical protein
MTDYAILVSAISDVGYWSWWSEKLPAMFQLEFGGAQIHVPPEDRTKPPSSLLALRFLRPALVSFIRRSEDGGNLPADWARQLKEDKIEPFRISHDEFALGDDALFGEVIAQTAIEIVHFTDESGGKEVKLAFWAGPVGMRIEAAEVRPVLMTGEIELSTVASLHSAWWSYWGDYWSKRDTAEPFPKDFACEVTIPLKQE